MTEIERLKAIIELMQQNKVKNLKIGDTSIELSDYYFAKQIISDETIYPEYKPTNRTLVDEVDKKDDDEMLFWSTPAGT